MWPKGTRITVWYSKTEILKTMRNITKKDLFALWNISVWPYKNEILATVDKKAENTDQLCSIYYKCEYNMI